MTQGGFLDTRRSSPSGLAMVVLLHAAALTALILAKGPQVLAPPPIFTVSSIPDIKDPPPETAPPPKAEPRTAPAPRIDTPQPLVPTLAEPVVRIDTPPTIEPIPLGPITQPAEIAVPVAEPKLVDAVLDGRRSVLQPDYPPLLARQEIEGRVTVKVLIGTDGRVKQVLPVSADDPLFHEATARQALRAWKFKPATRDGVPVESWRTMTVRFELRAG
ncbi:TonB family protein [Sphingomonas sp. 1P06PA]|uniref:energy transducer TonB n=1 Tax=Sphingomonas sp. 1P06PA TaxID=554121 RepID=UPI0039A6D98E